MARYSRSVARRFRCVDPCKKSGRLSSRSGRTQRRFTLIDLDIFQDDKKCACSSQPQGCTWNHRGEFLHNDLSRVDVEGPAYQEERSREERNVSARSEKISCGVKVF